MNAPRPHSASTSTKRLAWIDAARGIGILAVVYGHTVNGLLRTSIYTWHMPFFFFLSGFVYRTQGTWADYARHRARQLLVPYALWMVLVMLPTALGELRHHDAHALGHRLFDMAFGGATLAGPTTAYWFITSLYLALVLYDGLCRRANRHLNALCAAAFGLACLRSAFLRGWDFAWEADAILIALPLIHLGRLARRFDWQDRPSVLATGAIVFLGGASLIASGVAVPMYDIRAGLYGVPGLSLALALAGIAAVVTLAKHAGPLTGALAYLGRASLLIVLTHTAIQTSIVRGILPVTSGQAFVLCTVVPVALYAALNTMAWSRRYLLGEAPRPSATSKAEESNPLSDPLAKA